MNGNSGFVELTASDISTAIEALAEERIVAACRGGHGFSPAVSEHDAAYARWVETWFRQFSGMRTGRVFFASADMHRLRGILFTSYKTQLARRYRRAVLSDDPAYLTMVGQLCEIEEFETRMRDPEPFSGTVIGFNRGFPAGRTSRSA
jgi:hypothetical protein